MSRNAIWMAKKVLKRKVARITAVNFGQSLVLEKIQDMAVLKTGFL